MLVLRVAVPFRARSVRKWCSSAQNTMSKWLNVAEKNDAAKTIAQHLSGGRSNRREGLSPYNKIYEFEGQIFGQNCRIVMTSVSGHLLSYEFPIMYRGWTKVNPEDLFEAPVTKQCPENMEKIKKTLEKEVRGCAGLVIWTDCDREGENIGFEIIDVCRAVKPNLPVYRAKFSEITTQSVRRAISNLEQPDQLQAQAVDVRTELDLRIGAAFTRYQTLRLRQAFPTEVDSLVSYGSCQFPTLGFVARRYREVEAFIPQPFWKIRVTHKKDDLMVEFAWDRTRLFDQPSVQALLQLCQADGRARVKHIQTKPKSKWRPTPMDTVTLEKLASKKLKINAKRTMTIAEKLYQQGFTSYPRTETNMFSKEINLTGLVEGHQHHPEWGGFAGKVLSWGPNPRNGKKSDQAHPPIHPIKCATDLTGDEKKVYDLIARHFLACLSRDAQGSETTVQIEVGGEGFSASGLTIHERNYLEVYIYDKWSDKEIPQYAQGEIFVPNEIAMQEGSTTAPNLLTEADLIALMEKHGIGTDATHAEHINTIKERGYIGELEGGFLIPGTLGMGIVEGYEAMELALCLTEPKLRSDLEKDLKAICDGVRNPEDVLREQIQIYRDAYRGVIAKAKKLDEALGKRFNTTPSANAGPVIDVPAMEKVGKCRSCRQDTVLKKKRTGDGFFVSCLGYPGCKSAIWFPDDVVRDVKLTPEACHRCSSKILEFKFKRPHFYALLDCERPEYRGCITCDSKLREVLQIRSDRNQNGGNSAPPWNPPRPPPPAAPSRGGRRGNDGDSHDNNWGGGRPDNPRPRPPAWGGSDAPARSAWGSNSNGGSGWGSNSSSGGGGWNSGSGGSSGWNSNSGGSSGWNSNSGGRDSSSSGNPSAGRGSTWNTNPRSSGWDSNAGNPSAGRGSSWSTNPRSSGWDSSPGPSSRGNSSKKKKMADIDCSVCGKRATLLTTKQGPNTGRQFYTCKNSNPQCKFFKWADEVLENVHEVAASANKKSRKCGLCKQEGHTRKTCPMKVEDD